MKILLFLGTPGSNKTKAAQILKSAFDFQYISWGETLKKQTHKTDYAKSAEQLFRSLKLMAHKDNQNPIIIEGYPMHLQEAEKMLDFINKNGFELEAVVKFNSSLDKSLSRRQRRHHCPICHREYSKENELCPFDDSVLIKTNKKYSTKELEEEYHYFTAELNDVSKFLSNHCPIDFSIDADTNIQEVVQSILSGLYLKKSHNKIYTKAASAELETEYGNFKITAYQSSVDYSYHLALVKGDVENKHDVLVRVHSSCITGDILHSKHCDCGQQLDKAFKIISKEGQGVIMYLFQEGRGINIINKIKAYKLQAEGLDTVDANRALGMPSEMRNYEIVKDIIEDLKIKSIVLLTNNPDKITELKSLGVIVKGAKQHEIPANPTSNRYLKTKKDRMNHKLRKI
ncbi:MAG: GTP cyclohydrolase II [Candidatus Saccharibacteria bacterium]